jgi:flagellar biosynthesis protein FlhF
MKIKRFFAPDIRQAIRRVRETLGPDAVILSNKSVEGGIELVAAIDYDESAFATPPVRETVAAVAPAAEPAATPAAQVRSEPRAARVEWSQDPAIVEMRREMQTLRRLMENELGGLAWRDLGERRPGARELLRRLLELGLPAAMARALTERVGDEAEPEQLWRKALYVLANSLRAAEADLLDAGGVVAMVGPTGVGKTTTIAKLAARFVMRHGGRHLALVSTDDFRIGGREQLHTYGRILNVPVKSAGSLEELDATLNALADRRLVLIDTAGMGPGDLRLQEQLAMLRVGDRPVRRYLALAANTERTALERAVKAFCQVPPDACVLTKLDEAGRLGGLLATLIANQLPAAYVTDGQRVPEDLHLARTHTLVTRAAQLIEDAAAHDGAADAQIALALGGATAHAHL